MCDIYAVENTQEGEKVMILDPGATVSLAGRPWLSKYLEEIDCMVSSSCYQVFRFGGNDKRQESRLLVELPLIIRSIKGKDDVLKAQVYLIYPDVTFLCGKKTLEQ